MENSGTTVHYTTINFLKVTKICITLISSYVYKNEENVYVHACVKDRDGDAGKEIEREGERERQNINCPFDILIFFWGTKNMLAS